MKFINILKTKPLLAWFTAIILLTSCQKEEFKNELADTTTGSQSNGSCSNGNLVFDDMVLHQIVIDMPEADQAKMIREADEEQYYQAEFTFDGNVVGTVGIRIKGDGSIQEAMDIGGNAFPFKIDFNRYNPDLKLDGLNKINLHTELELSSVVNEYISYALIRAWNVPTARVSMAVLTMNGEDLGLYSIVEQTRGKFLKCNYSESPGNLYKFYRDPGQLTDVDNISNYANESLKWPDQSDHVSFTNLIQAINSGSIEAYLAVVDVQQQLRYMAANVGVANSDFYGNSPENYYLYEVSPGVFTMIPWDMNQSQIDDPSPCGIMNVSEEWPMIYPLLSNDVYLQQYFDYLKEFLNGPASVTNSLARLEQFERVVGDRISQVQSRVNETRETIQQRVPAMLDELNNGPTCD
ncbi:MAG: CotH kinase family protein [Bacteroidota bacterium]